MRQADRVTERQNDSMTVWQNSRAAKEPALVLFIKELTMFAVTALYSVHFTEELTMRERTTVLSSQT